MGQQSLQAPGSQLGMMARQQPRQLMWQMCSRLALPFPLSELCSRRRGSGQHPSTCSSPAAGQQARQHSQRRSGQVGQSIRMCSWTARPARQALLPQLPTSKCQQLQLVQRQWETHRLAGAGVTSLGLLAWHPPNRQSRPELQRTPQARLDWLPRQLLHWRLRLRTACLRMKMMRSRELDGWER